MVDNNVASPPWDPESTWDHGTPYIPEVIIGQNGYESKLGLDPPKR